MTPQARTLAARPDALALAENVARRFGRRITRNYPAIRSAAFYGLCRAAMNYDPARGDFLPYAHRRITGEVIHEIRVFSGYRKLGRVEYSDDAAASAPSDDLPVGWEAEYHDQLASFTDDLPEAERRFFLAYFGECRCYGMGKTGRAFGVSEGRAHQVLRSAFNAIKDRLDGKQPARDYVGVKRLPDGRFLARLYADGRMFRLGTFGDAESAARAYDAGRVATPFGNGVVPELNFPAEHPADWAERWRGKVSHR